MIGERFSNSPLVHNRVMRVERQISFSVGGLTIDLNRKMTVVLTTDSDIQKRHFPVSFPFNHKLDRWLDIVQMNANYIFHFLLMKVEGSAETLGLLETFNIIYTILTSVTFLFLNMVQLLLSYNNK